MKTRKLLAILIAAVMVFALLPASVFAADATAGTEAELATAITNAVSGNTITLTADITATETITIDKTLTLNLDGHKLSTADVTDTTNSKSVLKITSGTVTIKGTGTVVPGKTINSGSYNEMLSSAIIVQGDAGLTVQDGAVVQGGEAVNSQNGGHAILLWTTGTLNVTNSTILGGDCVKDSAAASGNYTNDGTAGMAIYVFMKNPTININGSTVKGGNGLISGYDHAYISNGLNQAAGGAAIDSLNSTFTCNITGSTVRGGNSAIYNAGDAINVGGGTFTITNSTVEGGDVTDPYSGESYGEGGTAINIDGSGSVTITDSNITGGDGGNSWIGCGIEYKNGNAGLSITNSVISGGGRTGTGTGFGNAMYIYMTSNDFNRIHFNNTVLQLGTGPANVYGGSALYDTKGREEEVITQTTGGNVTYAPGGMLIVGDPPAGTQGTVVRANADVTYTVVIPASVNFGTINKSMSQQSRDFIVSVQNAFIKAGATIKVANTTTSMVMKDNNGTGTVELPFQLTPPTATGFVFSGNGSITGHVTCNPSTDLTAPGSYKGFMTFSVTYTE